MSARNHYVSVAEAQYHVIDPTNLRSALDDGVEDGLHVRRRATDDAEHLGCRGLMLKGLAQFRIALLDLLEQPDIFDGNDGLRSEGLKQFYLPLAERTDFLAADIECSDRHAFA
jgi:hypothetical protein